MDFLEESRRKFRLEKKTDLLFIAFAMLCVVMLVITLFVYSDKRGKSSTLQQEQQRIQTEFSDAKQEYDSLVAKQTSLNNDIRDLNRQFGELPS